MTEADIIRQHIGDDVYALSMRSHWHEPYAKAWLVMQIQARQKAKSKLPSWYGNFDLLFPPPLSVEQCSSELAADYKASLVEGGTLADLTGGMGIDSAAFARRCSRVIFIEKDEGVAETARYNFDILGLDHVEVHHGDCAEILPTLPAVDHIYIDPARRKEGRKVFRLADCEPDLLALLPVIWQKTNHVIVKLSPMFDLTEVQRQLPQTTAIHVVAVRGEVKELLVELCRNGAQTPVLACVDLADGVAPRIERWERGTTVEMPYSLPLGYLYEPHAAVLKAGLMDALAARDGLFKLQKNSHLYTSDALHSDYFGRVFQVEAVFGMGKAELKEGLSGVTAAGITVRNFPLGAEPLRKRLKLCDGGDVTIFASTLCDGRHALLRCRPVR